jgi:hypothetical protein
MLVRQQSNVAFLVSVKMHRAPLGQRRSTKSPRKRRRYNIGAARLPRKATDCSPGPAGTLNTSLPVEPAIYRKSYAFSHNEL